MTSLRFIKDLQKSLRQPLPGLDAQLKMAPRLRYNFNPDELNQKNPRQSAVLILLFPEANEWHTCFILRQEYEGVHSGQISFPGGRFETKDGDFETTALREAEEEVGIDGSQARILGKLSPLYIPPSNFLVHPFVAYYPGKPDFVRQKSEVKEVLSIPLVTFCESKNIKTKTIHLANGKDSETPYYDLNGRVLWGATSMITSELSFLICKLLS